MCRGATSACMKTDKREQLSATEWCNKIIQFMRLPAKTEEHHVLNCGSLKTVRNLRYCGGSRLSWRAAALNQAAAEPVNHAVMINNKLKTIRVNGPQGRCHDTSVEERMNGGRVKLQSEVAVLEKSTLNMSRRRATEVTDGHVTCGTLSAVYWDQRTQQREDDRKQMSSQSDGAEAVLQWRGNTVGSSSGGGVNYKNWSDHFNFSSYFAERIFVQVSVVWVTPLIKLLHPERVELISLCLLERSHHLWVMITEASGF